MVDAVLSRGGVGDRALLLNGDRLQVGVAGKALPFACVSAAFLSKDSPFPCDAAGSAVRVPALRGGDGRDTADVIPARCRRVQMIDSILSAFTHAKATGAQGQAANLRKTDELIAQLLVEVLQVGGGQTA